MIDMFQANTMDKDHNKSVQESSWLVVNWYSHFYRKEDVSKL